MTSYLHATLLPLTIESALPGENLEWQVEEGMFMITNTQTLHYLVINFINPQFLSIVCLNIDLYNA